MRLATLVVLASGCGSTATPLVISPGDRSFSLAFLVEILDGRVTQVSDAFGLGDDAFGKPQLAVDEDSQVFLIAVDASSLADTASGFDSTRIASVTLRPAVPPIAPDVYADPVSMALPESAEVFRVSFEDGEGLTAVARDVDPLLADLTLDAPSDPGFCRRPLGELEFFGNRETLIDEAAFGTRGITFSNITEITELAPGRLVVASQRLVALVDRGGEIAQLDHDPVRTIDVDSVLSGSTIADLSLSPFGDPRHVVVVGTASAAEFIMDFLIDGDRLVHAKTTTTTAEGLPLPVLMAAHIDANGIMAVGARRGVWFTRAALDAPLVRRSPLAVPTFAQNGLDILAMTSSNDPTHPVLFGVRAELVFEGDLATGDFRPAEVRAPADVRVGHVPVLVDVAASADGTERWACGPGSLLHRQRPPQSWERAPITDTPELLVCTIGVPVRQVSIDFTSVAIDESHAYATISGCAGLFTFSRDTECIAGLGLPGRDVESAEPNIPVSVVRRGTNAIYVGGRVGRLLVLDTSP